MKSVTLKMGEETVRGEELDFEPLQERWSEYRCEDGSMVRIRLVVSRIVKLSDKFDPIGRPMFHIESTNVMTVSPA